MISPAAIGMIANPGTSPNTLTPAIDPATIVDDDGDGGGDKGKKKSKSKPAPTSVTVNGAPTDNKLAVNVNGQGLGVKVDPASIVPADPQTKPNFVKTNDPDVYMGANGVPITRTQFNQNQKSNMPFTSFETYADWVGGWAHPQRPIPDISPYYRAYGQGSNIPGSDILRLYLQRDPSIDAILSRNISKPGEVPEYGPQDSDNIRQLIAHLNTLQQ